MSPETTEHELDGKVAIFTGGNRGIGRAIAMDLASNGAHVAINYRRSGDEAEEFVRQIETMGRRGITVQSNEASFNDAQKMADTVGSEIGGLDILVNNAGMKRDGLYGK